MSERRRSAGTSGPAAPSADEPKERARFTKIMSEPVPIPEAAIERAVTVLRSGRLFRYGEDTGGEGEAASFERAFAGFVGRRHAVAINSCGCALFLAMKALGVTPGDKVLCSGFTLAPVPGAISHIGAEHVLVDVTERLTVDLLDLEEKAVQSGAKLLILSHMRGHVHGLDAVATLCHRLGVAIIEDCAHTLGARWDGCPVGSFGAIACYSSQTFKHINSGEGGILATDDDALAAKAIMLSGSYMMYAQNGTCPPEEVFAPIRDATPNYSMRMSNLVAAVLRPQLDQLDGWIARWNDAYRRIEAGLKTIPHIDPIPRDPRDAFVGSSIQFLAEPGLAPEIAAAFVDEAAAHGVYIKWFGADRTAGFTSRYDQWRHLADSRRLSGADRVLPRLMDMRIAVSFTPEDCRTIVTVLAEAMDAATKGQRG